MTHETGTPATRARRGTQIGIEIGARVVRTLVIRDGQIGWSDERSWCGTPSSAAQEDGTETPDLSLDSVLGAVLADARASMTRNRGRRRWRRVVSRRAPAVYVALSPQLAQLKRITGLAFTPNGRDAAAVIASHIGRYFLVADTPLVLGDVRWADMAGVNGARQPRRAAAGVSVGREHDGWVAAYSAPIVATIVGACARQGFRVSGIGPVAAVLGWALASIPTPHQPADGVPQEGNADVEASAHLRWQDAGMHLSVRVAPETRRPTVIRRSFPSTGDAGALLTDPLCRWAPLLTTLGPQAAGFAAAFGAAVVAGQAHALDPVSLRFSRRGERAILAAQRTAASPTGATQHRHDPVPPWRLLLAAGVCSAGIVVAAATPGLVAHRAAQRAGAALRALSTQRAVAAAVGTELTRASDLLHRAGADGGPYASPVALLAAIARALPAGAALIDFQCDGPDGRLVVLAPNAAAVLTGIANVPGLDGVEIVGPVTREPAPAAGIQSAPINGSPSGSPPNGPMGPAGLPSASTGAASSTTTLDRLAVRFRTKASGVAADRTRLVRQ